MRIVVPHTETLCWLHQQLGALDRWRDELTRSPETCCLLSIERLDAHRAWLARQLTKLERPLI